MHTVTEPRRLEGTVGCLVQPLPQAGPKLNTDHITQAFVQLGLEKFQGWRLHSPSGPLLQSLIAQVTFLLISHLNISISTFAWSRTGPSTPGSHERQAMGNSTFPWSASWVLPETGQHTTSPQGKRRAHESILWYGLSYRSSRPSKASFDIAQHHPSSTFPLHFENWAQISNYQLTTN